MQINNSIKTSNYRNFKSDYLNGAKGRAGKIASSIRHPIFRTLLMVENLNSKMANSGYFDSQKDNNGGAHAHNGFSNGSPDASIANSVLFENMFNAVVVYEPICDKSGKAIDCRYISANASYELAMGVKKTDIVGKRVLDIMPKIPKDLIETIGKVALTGENATIKGQARNGIWFNAAIFSLQNGHVAAVYENITDYKNTENKLQDVKERYAVLNSALDDGFWEWNVLSGQAFFSKIYYNMLGYEENEFPANYDSWRCLVHPDDIERAEQSLMMSIKSKKRFDLDLRMKTKSGEWMWVSTRGKAIESNAEGNVTKSVGTLIDITARKKLEMELAESEKTYRAMFEDVAVPKLLIDPESNIIIDANPAALRFYGYTTDEFIGASLSKINSLNPAEISVKIQNANEKKQDYFNFKHRLADGTIKDVEVYSGPIKINGRDVLLSIIHDATEKNQLARKNEAIIQTALDGYWETDMKGFIVGVSDEYCKMSGYTKEELIGKPISFLEAQETPAETQAHIETILSTGKAYFESIHRKKDGTAYPVEISTSYSNDFGGRFFVFTKDITERKAAENMLHASEEKYKDLVTHSHDPIFCFDGNRAYLYVNEAFAKPFGKKPDEIIGKTPFEIFPKAEAERRLVAVNMVFQTGEAVEIEVKVPGKNGETLYFSTLANPVKNSGGKVVSVSCISRNITDIKKVLGALLLSETRLQFALENTHQGVWDWNLASNEVFFSTQWKKMLGHEEHEVSNQLSEWESRVHPDDLKNAIRKVEDHISGKTDFYYSEHRVRTKSGNYLWIADAGKIVERTEDGKPSRMIGTHLDITERKNAENEMKESKILVDAIIENIPDMIFLKEAKDLRFVVFNRAGEELLGYDRKDLLGKNNLDLFPPEQAAHFMAKDRETLNGENQMVDIPEELIQTAKKGQRVLHTKKVSIKGADGTAKYLLGISEDITDRKQIEALLAQRNTQIANLQTTSSIGKLGAKLAHDSRNYLSSMLGAASLLKHFPDNPEKVKKYADMIESSAEKSLNLADLVAALSVNRDRSDFNLKKAMASAVFRADSERLFARDNRHIHSDISLVDGCPDIAVFGNQAKLISVVYELIVNSFESFESTEKAYEVKVGWVKAKTQTGEEVIELYVSDNGPGMAPEIVEHVFKNRITASKRSDEIEERGYGLLNVKSTLDTMLADIHVESKVGIGTTFFITLRLGEEKTDDKKAAPVEHLKNLRVLLVDDEPRVTEMTRDMLGVMEHTVVAFTDPLEALAALQNEKFDLLITDQFMPGLTGTDLAQKAREIDPKLPVMLVTGHGEFTLGADDQLAVDLLVNKPLRMEKIAVSIDEAVMQRMIRQARAQQLMRLDDDGNSNLNA